jgi:hypothetical protein
MAAGAAAAERALATLPDAVESGIARGDLAGAGAAASRLHAQLHAVEEARPGDRVRLRTAREAAGAACAARLARGLADDLLDPLAARTASLGDADVAAAEKVARGLRRLEEAGRALGAPADHDRALNAAWSRLAAPTLSVLDRADRMRLAEILFGPERASAMLGR